MKILIAKDEAFNFTYRANIDAMSQMGEVVFFSPLHDAELPACDLLYLPGGYPELFLDAIQHNASMCQQIRAYAQRGGRIFAECGGFMYLCQDIDDVPMVGALPFSATMQGAHLHLGYRQFGDLRGHEFHYSEIKEKEHPHVEVLLGQTSAKGKPVATPIYIYKNIICGYTHWYWAEQGFEHLWNSLLKLSDH